MSVAPSRIVAAAAVSPPTLFLGVSGVLHPSESTYMLARGRSQWSDGHMRYESVQVLEEGWPETKVVLTAAQARVEAVPVILEDLGPSLSGRVIGSAFDDVTTKVQREVMTREGAPLVVGYSPQRADRAGGCVRRLMGYAVSGAARKAKHPVPIR